VKLDKNLINYLGDNVKEIKATRLAMEDKLRAQMAKERRLVKIALNIQEPNKTIGIVVLICAILIKSLEKMEPA